MGREGEGGYLPLVNHTDNQVIQDNPELLPVDLVENDIHQRTNTDCLVTLVGNAIGHLNNAMSTVGRLNRDKVSVYSTYCVDKYQPIQLDGLYVNLTEPLQHVVQLLLDEIIQRLTLNNFTENKIKYFFFHNHRLPLPGFVP